jgi:Predicted Zn-dependent hydrolases of the beta-lactamase fold
MKISIKTGLILGGLLMAVPLSAQDGKRSVEFMPITHASFVMVADSATIYVDPTGDAARYANLPPPDIILVAHEHHDHFDKNLIEKLKRENTVIIGPEAVVSQLPGGILMKNGDTRTYGTIRIEAIPAYNITADRLQFHPKGEGNGYIVTAGGKRTYISGDTEDIPEMRALKNIDYAFICMNLPYTMTPEQAASAVLEFKPKVVFPYHYRQRDGFADINKFKQLVSKDKNIEVRLLQWYK